MFSSFYIRSYNRAPRKENNNVIDHKCNNGTANGKLLNGKILNGMNGIQHKQSNGFVTSPELNVEDLSPNTKKND